MHRILTVLVLMFAWLGNCFAAAGPKPATLADADKPASTPHIALLLPLKSAAFGRPADAVRKGFMTAFSVNPAPLPVKVYATEEAQEDILSVYRNAVQGGAQVVVGPLTRNAVTSLASSNVVSVPTLALNYPEDDTALPPQLYLFGLSIEAEARQIARTAFADGKRNAFVLSSGTPLAKRAQQAFLDEWQRLDGEVAGQANLPKDQEGLLALRDSSAKSSADAIFLAADADKARLARPYLNPLATVYTTSQVYTGHGNRLQNVDLSGVQFVDMPWLLLPDHPAVMLYPRQDPPTSADQDRLYALGIDALRLATQLLEGKAKSKISIDGVTGTINLRGQVFERELVPAQFQEGEVVLTDKATP